MNVSVTDLETIARVAQQIDANPLTLAGRLVGLGEAEQKAGVPMWAWATVALGAGVFVACWALPKIGRRFGVGE